MRKNINDSMDDLLVKYLLHEATPAEQEEVQQWCSISGANKRYFDEFKLIWEQSRQLAMASSINEEEAWLRFKQGLQKRTGETPIIPITVKKFSWLKIAAALFFVLTGAAVTYLYFKKQNDTTPVFVQSQEKVITDTLPDGSIVTLNKYSSLSYTKKFTGDTREVTLKGEAFFNVTPDKSKPFIITANDVTVKVVGTSFNVKSEGNKTEVIVETGIVEVAKQQKAVRLKPHEKIIVDKSKDDLYKQKSTDELYNYYKTKEFICDDTPLWRVVEMLNDVYHSNIIIGNNKLVNLPLTTTLPADSLNEALHVISQTFNIHVEKKDDTIVLK